MNLWPTKWRPMDAQSRLSMVYLQQFGRAMVMHGHARHTRTFLHHAILEQWISFEQLGVVNDLDIVFTTVWTCHGHAWSCKTHSDIPSTCDSRAADFVYSAGCDELF